MTAAKPETFPACMACRDGTCKARGPRWRVWKPRSEAGRVISMNLGDADLLHLVSCSQWLAEESRRSALTNGAKRRWAMKWGRRVATELEARLMINEQKFRATMKLLSDEDLSAHFIAAEKALNDSTTTAPEFLGWCVKWILEEMDDRKANGRKVDATPDGTLEFDLRRAGKIILENMPEAST